MFTANMVAPCGLDCSICKRALVEISPCAGCRGPNDNKPEFCSAQCGIILCEKRKVNGYSFCDECPDFPCADVMEKETRYGSKYPLRESPLENLRVIREAGMAAFLEHERRQWGGGDGCFPGARAEAVDLSRLRRYHLCPHRRVQRLWSAVRQLSKVGCILSKQKQIR